MSWNLPVIINHSLPDMLKARRGRAKTGLDGRGGPRHGKVLQGLTTARRINPSECCASLGPARSGVESMGEVRHSKHWQGLLTAYWFFFEESVRWQHQADRYAGEVPGLPGNG